jgi:beta-lactamase class A
MKKYFNYFVVGASLLLVISQISCDPTTHSTKALQAKLDSLVNAFPGTAGVYVRNLKTGETVGVNADSIFPTASIVKIPIVIGLFKKINQGDYTYHKQLLYRDSMAHGGSGLLQYFKDSTKIELSKVVTLMLARSDNTAALWCQKLAGGSKEINKWLANHGFKYTRDNSEDPAREKEHHKYGWGQTTPKEMANLLAMIRQDSVINPAASQRIYRDLSRTYWDNYALFQIPPYVHAASKQGMVNASRSEAVLVDACNGPYVYYVATKNNKDKTWKLTNQAWQLARNVSKVLWHHFEPQSSWKPPPGAKKYWK